MSTLLFAVVWIVVVNGIFQLRDGRKTDLEKHIQAVDAMITQASGSDSDGESAIDMEPWGGIGDSEEINREEEYVDDDRFTTVTVEAVDISRDGLSKVVFEDEESEIPNGLGVGDMARTTKGLEVVQNGKPRQTKQQPGGVKKKKRKFKYETKAERKITRYKEKLGNKTKASARKK